MAWAIGTLFSLAIAGCLSKDPAHCANREGNATCAMLGEAPYCSICVSKNYGCVEKEPENRCYRPGNASPSEDASGGGTTDPATTEASSEGSAGAECAPPQGGDASCSGLDELAAAAPP